MAMKIVIGTKSGKSLQKELEDTKPLFGKKIGDSLKGEFLDLPGYEFTITGGSDAIGFPMRKDVNSTNRVKILAVEGVGLRKQRSGKRVRKTVAGGIVGPQTAQLNLKITKEGKTPLFEEPAATATDDEASKAEA